MVWLVEKLDSLCDNVSDKVEGEVEVEDEVEVEVSLCDDVFDKVEGKVEVKVSLCDDVFDEVEGKGEDHCGVLFCADAVQGLGEVIGQDCDYEDRGEEYDGSVPSNYGNGSDNNDTRMRARGGGVYEPPFWLT